MRARIIKTISAVKKFLRIDAEGREDETMKNVLLLEPYGYQSRPPADSQCVVINDGGINYAMNADSTDNKKSLSEEETVIYSGDNSEIYLKPDGTIDVKALIKFVVDSVMTEIGTGTIDRLVKQSVFAALNNHTHTYSLDTVPTPTSSMALAATPTILLENDATITTQNMKAS